MESGSPDCPRDSLFQASSSPLPSSRLSSRPSHRRSASPRPSLDRRNADAGTAAPSHHQATTREIGRGNRQTAEACLWTENTMASSRTVQLLAVSAVGGTGLALSPLSPLSPAPRHPRRAIPAPRNETARPGHPPSLAPSLSPVSLCLATNNRLSRWHTTGWTIRTTSLLSLPWKQLGRQPCISMCARPISSAICWAFSFCRQPTRYSIRHTSPVVCRLPLCASPGTSIPAWPGNGSRLLIAHPAPSVAEACKNAICSLA